MILIDTDHTTFIIANESDPTTAFSARLIKPLWHFHQGHARVFLMSTIAEIEAAIELLSPQQVEELASWLNSLRRGGRNQCRPMPG